MKTAVDSTALEPHSCHQCWWLEDSATRTNMMIDKKADLTAQTFIGHETPLHAAVEGINHHFVSALVTRNASLSQRCVYGGTALHWAAMYADAEMISILVQAGMSVLDTDNNNRIPLLWAFRQEVTESRYDVVDEVVIQLIITHGSPFNHLDNNRQNILHFAATNARPRMLRFF